MRRLRLIAIMLFPSWSFVTAGTGVPVSADPFTVVGSIHTVSMRGPGNMSWARVESTWANAPQAAVVVGTFWQVPPQYGWGSGFADQFFRACSDSLVIQGTADLNTTFRYGFPDSPYAEAQSSALVRFRLDAPHRVSMHAELWQEVADTAYLDPPGWSEWVLEDARGTIWNSRIDWIDGTTYRLVDMDRALAPGEYVLRTLARARILEDTHRAGFSLRLVVKPQVSVRATTWSSVKALYDVER